MPNAATQHSSESIFLSVKVKNFELLTFTASSVKGERLLTVFIGFCNNKKEF
jgi:hypothetical protein